ncbi:MAG: hypothetical protein JXB46_01275, partial [Candidatus Eisenbacteria bacterium]|nr:hypothetical protein [Candidatus Eisenbacteria bacterium]
MLSTSFARIRRPGAAVGAGLATVLLCARVAVFVALPSSVDAAPASASASVVVRPVAPPRSIDADGYLKDYKAINFKAVDPVYDDADPDGNAGDLMAFYADQGVDRLVFRVGMFMMESIDGSGDCFRGAGTRVYVFADYEDGGTMAIPDGVGGRVPIMWDTCVRLGYGDRGSFEETAFAPDLKAAPDGIVRASAIVPALHTLEGSINL